MADKFRSNLIFALVFMSLGGMLLHLRIHPIFFNGQFEWERLIPLIFDTLSILIIPLLFLNQNTSDLAYLLTGLGVILGIITMSHLSIATWQGPVSLVNIILKTTIADSLVLSAKILVAKTIFESYYPEKAKLNCSFPQTFRFLFDGWWLVHLLGISAVYTLGVVIFK
ncbi:MAG: hypothetical protein AABY43_03085 [Candidatus Omnitrophota bacterium]